MTRMNTSMAIQVAAQRLALAQLQAHARRLGVRQRHTPAQMKAQAQEWLQAHPEVVEVARTTVAQFLTDKTKPKA